ncbi:MAG: hypothetical protein E6R13_03755 [Spirochaetes bacterium]|nr:MAG: hypothetical protein E6R13_03755 [Spirochaetota bacterium]
MSLQITFKINNKNTFIFMQAELIKNTKVSDFEIIELRENFVWDYCQDKGWDRANLSFEQILEIRAHKEWKNPLMQRS